MFPSTQLVETITPGKCLHSPTLGTCPDLLIISYESSSDYQSFKQHNPSHTPPCLFVQLYMGSSKVRFSVKQKIVILYCPEVTKNRLSY